MLILVIISPVQLNTVQLKVTAKPHPSAPPTSYPLSSSTACRILHALDSLSSPLADARKLPLRATVHADRQVRGVDSYLQEIHVHPILY